MTESSFYPSSASPNAFREKEHTGNQCFGIEIVPGTRCQLQCEACYKRTRERISVACQRENAQEDTPLADATDYISQAQEAGFREVALLGGEPTLHRDVFHIIRHIRDKNMTPILATNGIRFAKDGEAEKLEGTATTIVTHAYIPENGNGEHRSIDAYSGRKGYAEILKRAIDNLARLKDVTLVLEMPLVDSLYPHAFEFFRYCRERQVVPFIEISRSNDRGQPTSSVTPEQIRQLFERFQAFDAAHFPEKAAQHIHPPAYGNPCTMPITGVHVKNFGSGDYGGVYSCCAQHLRHGDLKEQSLEEILKSPTLAVYRDQDTYIVGPCRDCELYDTCKGGCRGEAVLRFGCPRASSPACHRIPPEVRNDPTIMAPQSCEGCPAEHAEGCSLLHRKNDAAFH
ncbi:MAG: radical SAM protein [Candidatus Peribacteraceae bacterium]|nr:radical SAM protein [Candidatus Peribacteraceae bacterium]